MYVTARYCGESLEVSKVEEKIEHRAAKTVWRTRIDDRGENIGVVCEDDGLCQKAGDK